MNQSREKLGQTRHQQSIRTTAYHRKRNATRSHEMDQHGDSDSDTSSDATYDPSEDEPDGHNTTVAAEGIHENSYVLWNMLTASFGAMAVFTCNGASRCHFDDSVKATRFALALAIVPQAPQIVAMFEETRQIFEATVQHIRATLTSNQFRFDGYSRF